jgi:hypothetical protein
MAITVNSGGTVASTIVAGATAGQQRERSEFSKIAYQGFQQRLAQEQRHVQQMESMEASQLHQRRMADDAFDKQMYARDTGMLDAFANDLVRRRLDRDEFEYRLTAQQKADQIKYQNARYELMHNDSFTDEEKELALRQIDARLAGIEPIPIRKDPPQWEPGRGVGEAWVDNGMMVSRKPDGTLYKVGELASAAGPSPQDRVNAYKEWH